MSTVYSKEKSGSDLKGGSNQKAGSDLRIEYQKFISRKMLFLLILILGIIGLAGYAATRGSADISVTDVYATILAKFFPGHFQTTWFSDTIVWGLRLHRILLAIVGGIGLAVAGAVMQGNPEKSPGQPIHPRHLLGCRIRSGSGHHHGAQASLEANG